MKITAIAVLGLSFFGSAKGSLDALKPNRAVLGSFESTQMGTPGHAMVASEAFEVSNFQRKLASITYENGCDTGNGADRCCHDEKGRVACYPMDSNTENIVISKGSCVGALPCQKIGGDTFVGEYSCGGGDACTHAGIYTSGTAIIGSNSCKGYRTCYKVGAGGEATIGSNSCLGNELGDISASGACYELGQVSDGKATVGDNSCVGFNACANAGAGLSNQIFEKKSIVTIGKNSCRGDRACMQAGKRKDTEGHSEVFIGDDSCNGVRACLRLLSDNGQQGLPALTSFPEARIGKNSCNCENCCRCLIHGDIVPDDSCNSRGSAANQCCTDGGGVFDRNPNFNFDNAAGDLVTGPTAPTLPGSLASQATTTAYVAPAEFDVTLTTSPGCVFAAGAGTIGTITCTFDTKGAAEYYMFSALYETDCVTTGTPTGVSLGDTPVTPALESGSDKQYESTYAVTLPVANSAAATGTDLAFCLKTEVKDKDGIVYDWTGQKIRLAISVDGTFTTDSLSTQTFDGATAAEQNVGASSFGVSINRCDENGGEVTSGTALTVGENFYLCVKGKQSQVIVSNIGEMTAAKTGATSLSLVTATSTGSEGTVNSNTFVYGNGQNQVVIATRLPATFFASGGAVTFSGSANIVVGARRRLSRSMQVASVSSEESANFSMDIQVAGMDDASSASAIKTTAAMFFAAAVAALIV